MKLKKDAPTSIDLAEEEKHSIYKRIADEYGSDIPIMANLPKVELAEDVHFKCMGRVKRIAEILLHRSNRYRTSSDVFRSICYLGAHVLYHLIPDEKTDRAKHATFYRTLGETTEDVLICKTQVEEVMGAVSELIEAEKLGYKKPEVVNDRIAKLIDALPEDAQHTAKVLVEKIRSESDTPQFRRYSGRDERGRFKS